MVSEIPELLPEDVQSIHGLFLHFRFFLRLLDLVLFSVDTYNVRELLRVTVVHFAHSLESFGLRRRFTAATFLVFFALP